MIDLEHMIRERGLKKTWIAERIGVSGPYFSHMLRGRMPIPPEKIGPLARVLRYPIPEVRKAASVTAELANSGATESDQR